MTAPDTPPYGYAWCSRCGQHLALLKLSPWCPVCDDEELYAEEMRANRAKTDTQVRFSDQQAVASAERQRRENGL